METYEQYPLLGVDREGGTLVGRRCEAYREDMCGEIFRRGLGDWGIIVLSVRSSYMSRRH